MNKIPSRQQGLGQAAVLGWLAVLPLCVNSAATDASAAVYADPVARPQLVQGYRNALGLKLSPSNSRVLGRGSTATQLAEHLARADAVPDPLVYEVERVASALGLRGTERVVGVVLHSGGRWTSSVEVSSAESALMASRQASLLGQVHAPLAGGVGVSLGIRYSSLWTQGYAPGSADSPFGNGYVLPPGRADSSAQQLGYQLQLNYLYGERNTVALTYHSRRESDQFRLGSDPNFPDGSQLSVTGVHWFSPSWALRYDIPTPEGSSLIRRPGLRLGVHYRF